jgi:hypothetical protein
MGWGGEQDVRCCRRVFEKENPGMGRMAVCITQANTDFAATFMSNIAAGTAGHQFR